MSLHHLAKHMQSQGRDGDTGLVHMSPGEIGALQKLAMANGGSLTVNPETGLPEAGFLKDWLPAIVGGLTMLIPGVGPFAAMALAAGTSFGTSMAVGNSFKKSLFTGLMTGAGGAATAGLGGLGAGAAGAVGKTALQAGAGTALRTAPQIAAAELGGVGSTALTQGAFRGAGVGAAESLGSKALSSTLSTAVPRAFSAEAQQLAQEGAKRGLTQEAGMLAQPGRIFAGAAPRPGVTSYTGTAGQTITPEQFGTSRLAQARPTPYTAKPIEPLPANYGPSSYGGTQAPAPISDISSVASGADKYANLSMGDRLAAQGKGVEKLFTEKGAAKQFVTDNKGSLALAGIGAIGSNLSTPQTLRAPPPEVSTYAGPYKPVERKARFQIGPQAYTDTSEFQYFDDVNPFPGVVPYKAAAAGGLMGLAGGGSYDDEAGHDGYADGGEVGTRMATPDMDAIQNYVQSISRPQEQQMAMGGMTSLARGGNYLDGPGDGLSDSIRATIGNRQPARLADGEFVISADVVSDIGGGSSKAGAKKLHAMQDRVRQAAHGTKKQVKKLDDRKVLAA